MAPCTVESKAGQRLQMVVPWPGHPQRRGPFEVARRQRQFGVEAVLQLPERAIRMRMRSRENLQAAEGCNVPERRLAENGTAFEAHVAVVGLDHIAARPDAAHGLIPEPPHARLDLGPMTGKAVLSLALAPEAPAVLRRHMTHVEAHWTGRRRREMALPEAAVVANVSG